MTAKQRILQYLDYKNISQYDFSKKTGLSNGFLKSGSSVNSDNLRLLSTIFLDLNIEWVIIGEGEMIKGGSMEKRSYPVEEKSAHEVCIEKEKIIETLNKLVATQEELVESLKEQLRVFKEKEK